jgi:hypothetical protein
MSVLRDYGTFSKTAARLLKPMLEPLGYSQIKGAAFGRQRDDWIEGFFLQQSGWGGGHFYVNVGFNVPALDDLWKTELKDRSFGLILGGRLGSQGIEHGAESYPAENLVELKESLVQVANALETADSWFAKFQSLTDVAIEYKLHNGGAIANINSGFLLLLAGKYIEAREKLETARRTWQKIVLEEDPHLQRKRPGKESLSFHALNVHRLAVIEAALRDLP